jgi:4-amino-4-deoxy-L-arabinose transferase-like glycosyltransferase
MPPTPQRVAAADPNRAFASALVQRPRSPGSRTNDTDAWPTGDLALLAGIVAVALALRFPGLTESIWFDELWSTRVKVGTLQSLVRTVAVDVHPPFYLALMFGWIRVFGDSELSVRMLPLLSGLGTVALAAPLARAYGGRVAGFVAALLLALSPVHIWYSQEARHYAFLLLVLVASVLVFHRIRATNDWRWYAAYLALAMCLVFTHYFAVAYVGAMALLALPDRHRRWPMITIAALAAGAVALFLAYKARRWGLPTSAGSLGEFELIDFWRLPFEWFLTGGALGAPASRAPLASAAIIACQLLILVLMVLGLLCAGGRWAGGARPGRGSTVPRVELALLLVVVPVGLAVLGALGARQYYNDRSALGALPFFAAAVGAGVARLRPWPQRIAGAVIVLFGSAVLAAYYAKHDEWTVYKPNADWRAVAGVLAAEQRRTGAPVIVVSMSPALELNYYASFGLVYYSNGNVIPDVDGTAGRVYVIERPDVAIIREILAREGASAVYVARNAYWVGTDPPNHVILATDELIRLLAADPSFVMEPAADAKGVRLLRVRPAGPAISR